VRGDRRARRAFKAAIIRPKRTWRRPEPPAGMTTFNALCGPQVDRSVGTLSAARQECPPGFDALQDLLDERRRTQVIVDPSPARPT